MKNVVLIGFPKSATTTLDKAFLSTGYNSYHHHAYLSTKNNQSDISKLDYAYDLVLNDEFPLGYISELLYSSYKENGNPYSVFDDCEPYALTQIDSNLSHISLWPQLDYELLVNGLKCNDSVCYILNYREPRFLVDSMIRWKNGKWLNNLIESDVPGLPVGRGKDFDTLVKWINNHYNMCRDLFSKNERFLEVDINSDNFRYDVEKFLGITFKWWGVANKNLIVEPEDTNIKIKYL